MTLVWVHHNCHWCKQISCKSHYCYTLDTYIFSLSPF